MSGLVHVQKASGGNLRNRDLRDPRPLPATGLTAAVMPQKKHSAQHNPSEKHKKKHLIIIFPGRLARDRQRADPEVNDVIQPKQRSARGDPSSSPRSSLPSPVIPEKSVTVPSSSSLLSP